MTQKPPRSGVVAAHGLGFMAKERRAEEARQLAVRLATLFIDHDRDCSLTLDEYELPEATLCCICVFVSYAETVSLIGDTEVLQDGMLENASTRSGAVRGTDFVSLP